MTTSYNGWPASTDPASIGVRPFVVEGVTFEGGVRGGDVATVLAYVLTEFHHRVEPLRSPGCWGWSYRPDRNDPSKLSCHSSATAADANAPEHPNGIEASHNFTAAQIVEIHRILAEIDELAEVVHWGGDWHYADGLTPDPMHWEIHDHDLAKLARVVARIQAKETPVANRWTRTRTRLLDALNHPDAKGISPGRVAIRAFLALTRRGLRGLPKE